MGRILSIRKSHPCHARFTLHQGNPTRKMPDALNLKGSSLHHGNTDPIHGLNTPIILSCTLIRIDHCASQTHLLLASPGRLVAASPVCVYVSSIVLNAY